MDISLDEVLYVDAIASSSTGAAADADSTPTFAVMEEATDTDIGIGGNMTKRTSLTGNYRAAITLSAANGFELGKWYVVVGSATIGGIATKGILKHFRVKAAENVAGYPTGDLNKWLGGTIPAVNVTGVPKVDATHVAGTAQTAGDLKASITAVDDEVDGVISNVGDIQARVILVQGYVDTEVAAILAKVTNLPSDPADASDLAALLSAISAYIDTEVADIRTRVLLALPPIGYDLAGGLGTNNSSPRTIYLAASGGSDGASGLSRSLPLATREQALTNARNGDKIHLLAGTYSWTTAWDTSSKSNLTIQGDGVATLVNLNTSTNYLAAINLGDYSGVQNLKVVCTGTHGSPIQCTTGSQSPWAHNMVIDGKDDAILFVAIGPRITHCTVSANWDVITVQFSTNAYVADNYIFGTAEQSNGKLLSFENATGVSERNIIVGCHTAANNNSICGIFTGQHTPSAVNPEQPDGGNPQSVISRGDIFLLRNDAGTGRASAITDVFGSTTTAGNSLVDVQGGSMEVTNSVDSAKAFHVRMLYTSGSGRAVGVNGIDSTKCTSNVTITDGRMDFANTANPTTTLNLSGLTIKNATDINTKIGTPAVSVSADIAAAKADTAAILIDTGTTLPAQIDDIEGGGGGGGDLTDTNHEHVPDTRRYVLEPTSDEGLIGDAERSIMASVETTLSIDFAADMPANGWIRTVDAVDVVSGSGLTISDFGRDHSEAKFRVTGTAGAYEIAVSVTYNTGSAAMGIVTLNIPTPAAVLSGGTVGSSDSIVLTDVDQEPVPTSRVFKLVGTRLTGLVCETAKSIPRGLDPATYAVDFAADCPANGRVATVSSVQIVDGDDEGLTISNESRDRTQAKFRIVAVTAGTYVLNVAVVYTNGDGARGQITFTAP